MLAMTDRRWGWLAREGASGPPWSVQSLAGEFFAYLRARPHLGTATKRLYLAQYGSFVKFVEERTGLGPDAPLAALGGYPNVLDAFADGHSAETVNLLRRFLRWAADRRLCDAALIEAVPTPRRRPATRPPAVGAIYLDQLLARVGEHSRRPLRYQVLIVLYALTGLRNTELRAALLSDLHLDGLEPHLDVRVKGGTMRQVQLGPQTVSLLRMYVATLGPDTCYLFPSPRDSRRPLSARAVQEAFQRFARGAGLPRGARPHSLRHGAASDLRAAGEDLGTIRDFLHHQHVATTEHYLADDLLLKRRAAERQEARVAPTLMKILEAHRRSGGDDHDHTGRDR